LNAKKYSKFDTLNTAFAISDAAWIYSIEAENEKTFSYNKTIPLQDQLDTQNTKIKDAMNVAIQPIWRPDTTFVIQAELVDKVVDDTNPPTTKSTDSQYYNFGFRTKGTIGNFHTYRAEYDILEAQKREDEFMLATFKPYINYERSYPNADSNLLNATPICPAIIGYILLFISMSSIL